MDDFPEKPVMFVSQLSRLVTSFENITPAQSLGKATETKILNRFFFLLDRKLRFPKGMRWVDIDTHTQGVDLKPGLTDLICGKAGISLRLLSLTTSK